jgi:organic hydroperoxide reductase OsmC/OhrA
MATAHRFEGRLSWRAGGTGLAGGNHRMEFAGRPALELSSAPQYKGDPARLSPEDLFVGALSSCQMLSYLALAGRAGVTVLAYDDQAAGTLAIADKKMRMTEVVLRPRITLAAGADGAKALALVHRAHENCFIANSVACAVRIEPEIVTGA